MEKIITDSETGRQYKLDPSPKELERGVVQFVPELHAHLWSYITVNGQVYSNNPELVDWDEGVDEWKESVMGQWPFGTPPSEEQRVTQEALDCLDYLDYHLEYEEWVMEQVEAENEDHDDDDNDDDDDDDVESEDEGYNSEAEGDDGNDTDDEWVFGLAPMLMNIYL